MRAPNVAPSLPNANPPSLNYLLSHLSKALQREIYRGLACAGFPEVRLAHGQVLHYIGPKGARITELAHWAGMSKQSIGYLVNDLAQLGLLQLTGDPRDGRARLAHLTARGQEAVDATLELSQRVEAGWAKCVGSGAMETTRQALEHLTALMRAYPKSAAHR